jgi:hypothetical protein
MRVLVCGGRDYRDLETLKETLAGLRQEHPDMVVICGYNPHDARYQGADQLAYLWAKANRVPVFPFPAFWEKYGRPAGPLRNRQMMDDGRPQLVVAFPGGDGTANMVAIARAQGVQRMEIPA